MKRTHTLTIALFAALSFAVLPVPAQVAEAKAAEATSPEAAPTTAPNAVVSPEVEALQKAGKVLQEKAIARLEPLADGKTKVLEAVVMSVKGRAQWRQTPADPWRKAKIHDLLKPGAMIRTGRRSELGLRVGHNASIFVQRNTRINLPGIVQDRDQLRSVIELRQGRADFKVDRVGLINDFTVVTPSTTLAVRGTSYGVHHGGLRGTTIVAAKTNTIRSIEVKYFLTSLPVFLSEGDGSSETTPDPAATALFDTFGPPRYISLFIEEPELLELILSSSPVRTQRAIDTRNESTMMTTDDPIFEDMDDDDDPPFSIDFDGFPIIGNTRQSTAEFICEIDSSTLFQLVSTFDMFLDARFSGGEAPLGSFNFPGVDDLYADIGAICQNANENGFSDQTLDEILNQVSAYCIGHFGETNLAQQCVDLFTQAAIDTYAPPGAPTGGP